jgi:hypothetical protein
VILILEFLPTAEVMETATVMATHIPMVAMAATLVPQAIHAAATDVAGIHAEVRIDPKA